MFGRARLFSTSFVKVGVFFSSIFFGEALFQQVFGMGVMVFSLQMNFFSLQMHSTMERARTFGKAITWVHLQDMFVVWNTLGCSE